MNRKIVAVLGYLVLAAIPALADRLSDMISPITNPTTFEDPRNESGLRFIYAHHVFDDAFVTTGGDLNIYALQARFALNDRWSIIATKDGFVDFNPDAVLAKDNGLANIAGGVKWAFYKNDAAGHIASAMLQYEAATGDEEVLQGNGDGLIIPSVSAAFSLNDNATFMVGSNMRIAMDDADSSFWEFNFHLDNKLCSEYGDFYPLVELSIIQVLDAGTRLGIPDEGVEFFNFGASGAEDKTIVQGGFGARYRAMDNLDFGLAYQVPLNSGEGTRAVDWRLTADAILRF